MADISASDYRISRLINFIEQARSRGTSDAEIRDSLSTEIPNEVEAAFSRARSFIKNSNLHPLVLVLGGSALLYFAGGVLKNLAIPVGAVGTAYWFMKGKPVRI